MSLHPTTTGLALEYDSGILPPPYSHVFRLTLDWSKGNLSAQLDLHYTDREELTEEEIFEEGFSLEDDYRFRGSLPSVWIAPLGQLLQASRWTKKGIDEGGITLTPMEGTKSEGLKIPSNQEEWQLMAQDLIQAIYELEKKEAPLTVHYRKVEREQISELSLTIHFSNREAVIVQSEVSKNILWEEAIALLKVVFMPDYRYEQAKDSPGNKRGAYLECGDGFWHELGKGVVNSHASVDAVGKIKAGFDRLLEV
ncbi:MAG: hypothetical protein O3A40_04070 [Bacteroidetes bacterium]|nr:hypothetical protein [Bacteroidota bacterium]